MSRISPHILLSIPIAFSIAAAGCATSAPTQNAVDSRTQNSNWNKDNSRDPASVEINAEYELIFQRMLSSGRIEDNLQLKIDQIEYAYWMGIGATADFDALLASEAAQKNPSEDFQKLAFEKGISPRLSAIEAFRNEAQEQLKYHFLRLNEVYASRGSTPELREKIEAAFSDIEIYLSRVPKATRVALNDWAEEMHEIMPNSKVLKRAYQHLFVGDANGMQAWLSRPEVAVHQKHMVKKVAGLRLPWLDSLIVTFTTNQKEQFEDDSRSPQSVSARRKSTAMTAQRIPKGSAVLLLEGNPAPAYTSQVVDKLAFNHTKATFFVPTIQLDSVNTSGVSTTQAIAKQGFKVESSSFEAFEMPKLYDEELNIQTEQGFRRIQQLTNRRPQYIKPPFGADSGRVGSVMNHYELQIVRANVQSYDWMDRNIEATAQRVLLQVKLAPSSIVLLRMDLATSPLLVEKIMQGLQASASGPQLISLEEVAK